MLMKICRSLIFMLEEVICHIDFILDNAAQVSIFGNPDLLSSIQNVDRALNFRGIHGKGKSCDLAGNFLDLVTVYHDKDLDINILSFSDAKRNGRMSYNDVTDVFIWHTSGRDYLYMPKKDMYVLSSTCLPNYLPESNSPFKNVSSLAIVAENEKLFTKERLLEPRMQESFCVDYVFLLQAVFPT